MAAKQLRARPGARWWALMLAVTLAGLLVAAPPALADIDDDGYDGNIFALYGGNGSLVPPKVTLPEAIERDTPTLLVYYLNDSRDCKQYSQVVSRLQRYYGRAAYFIPINVDSIPPQAEYTPQDPGYYYRGRVPQTVLLDGDNQIAFDRQGQVPFEVADAAFREVFDLLPREESLERKPRSSAEDGSSSS